MRHVAALVARVPAFVLECAVRGYQVVLSPLLVGSCKFVPSCSDYFIQAVRQWGVWHGAWLGVRRLLRCHPLGPGGIDPVPQAPRKPVPDRRPVKRR